MRALLIALVALSACGIKGPPRPPLEAVAARAPVAVVPPPDAGCCQDFK